MARYTGEHCPVCEKAFCEGDDIVVCPECGTPYHRECWKKAGDCLHKSEHAAGFEWKPSAVGENVCPNCGTRNAPGREVCSHCGVPLPGSGELFEEKETSGDDTPIYARQDGTPQREPRIETYSADRDGAVYRRAIGPDDPIDGIKARDWASFVGRRPLYYLMQFFRLSETKQKISLCFSALIFGPGYFFYRKMWKQGFVFAALDLVFGVPAFLLFLSTTQSPYLQGLNLSTLVMVNNVFSILDWAMRIGMALFAVYWYKQEAAHRIQAVYDTVPEGPQRAGALAEQGGVSVMAVVLYGLSLMLVAAVLAFLSGPALLG